MKTYIASDIHGNALAAAALVAAFKEGNGDRLIILGDLYNHGPRNPIQKGYDPMAVVALLNGIKDKVVAIKGNCDSEVDEFISQFKFYKSYTMATLDKTFYFTHGHVYNITNPPAIPENSIVFHGHFHQHTEAEKDGVTYMSPGSVGIPFDGDRGYFILESGKVEWMSI
jgi:putative phosphoesterase